MKRTILVAAALLVVALVVIGWLVPLQRERYVDCIANRDGTCR